MKTPDRFACPCCGEHTLDEQPPGTHEICGNCHWQDDALQFYDDDREGGANGLSLRQARARYRRMAEESDH